ncbi:MAG: thrombospondin type 3 repeat-containing protein, partial [Verrucomicrobiales bacterium]|nr:thrombospondin type 3 repeat-containing protein [Verrucomicrobiales bacterium]
LGVMFRGATDTFRAYDLSTGSVVQTLMQTLAAGSEYVFGRFSATNPLSQLLFYRPGTVELIWHQVLEPTAGIFSLGAANSFNFPGRVLRIYVVPGGTNPRLLVVYANGAQADVFDFNGVSAPVLAQSFTADAAQEFTGAALLGNGHFMLLSGDAGTGLSTRFQTWNFTGTNYIAGQSGSLPFLGRVSAAGNVLLFRGEPFVTNQPGLVRVLNAGDWTSQFRATGAPPIVTVNAERYTGPTNGLRNPTATALGEIPSGVNFGLINQYTNFISVFSLRAPAGDEVSEVRIAPEPGRYNRAIDMTLTPGDPTHLAFYRIGSGAWVQYTAPVRLFTNVTVQYYARPPTGLAKSAIRSASYAFTDPPSTLDSDNDGVPDFVELGRGLDPNGGSDSDGDGYSDLEELLRGTNPLAAGSVPTNAPRLEFNAAFDRAVTPRPYDGPADVPTFAATGTVLRVFTAAGSLLAVGSVTNLSIPGVLNPAARLTNIIVQPEDRLLVEATELHFDILTANADKRLGRELVGLLVAPQFTPLSVSYTFGGGNLVAEANAWIAAASNAWAGLTRPISKGDLTVRDTLTAALVERKIGDILVSRGLPWGTNITLFSFRPGDAARTNLSRELLLWLETEPTNGIPAWRLSTLYQTISNLVETSSAGAIMNLRAVATEIFDICSTHNNANPARFTPPLDQLRRFLRTGNYDAEYSDFSIFHGIFASAHAGAASILAAVPPRPVTNVLLTATLPGGGSAPIQFTLHPGSTPVKLYKNDGSPYDLPDSFAVLPGSLLQVRAFADLPNPPGGLALEVIRVNLTSIPMASDSDLDGNLLVDTWERL